MTKRYSREPTAAELAAYKAARANPVYIVDMGPLRWNCRSAEEAEHIKKLNPAATIRTVNR